MSYNKKNIWKAELFDKIRINIPKELEKPNARIKRITESEDYIIYKYTEERVFPSVYILGQSKKNPNSVFYLGTNNDHICVYKENLFMCNSGGELNTKNSLISITLSLDPN